MTSLTSARFALPVVLVLALLVLAVAMIIEGSTPTVSRGASDARRSVEAPTDAVPAGTSVSLAWPLALVVVALALAACWRLHARLQCVRHQRNAGLQEREHLRQSLDEAQAANARLHTELQRRTEQVRSLEGMLRASPAAARSSQQTTLRAPGSPKVAGAAGRRLVNERHLGEPHSPAPGEADPSRQETLVAPPRRDRPGIGAQGAQLNSQDCGQRADSGQNDQALREMAAKNVELLQKWRDCERARLEEQESLRRQHRDELARVREQASGEQQEAGSSLACRVQELEAECERLRTSLEQQMAKMWPAALLTQELEGLRRAIAQGMEAAPPASAAVALFGMIHHLCASARTERARDAAFEMSRAFYLWSYEAGQVNSEWEEQLATWLTALLKDSRMRVVVVKPGEPVSARLHSPDGSGHQVRRPQSFLVLREDGTPYKRAIVAT